MPIPVIPGIKVKANIIFKNPSFNPFSEWADAEQVLERFSEKRGSWNRTHDLSVVSRLRNQFDHHKKSIGRVKYH